MPMEFRDASNKRVTVSATNPLPVVGSGGGGSGTEYTEDAAAVANPVGGVKMLRRRDTLTAAEVSADGDIIAANATAKGEAYVKDTDAAAARGAAADAVATTDTGTFSLIALTKKIASNVTAMSAKLPAALGRLAAAASTSVTLATEDKTALDAINTNITSTAVVTNAKGAPSLTAVLATQFPVNAKFVNIAASSSGDNVILALVTSKKIRVLALSLMANGAVNAKFEDNGTTTQRGGMIYCPAAGYGKVLPFNPVGWFETASGVGLDLNLSAAVAVGGELVYEEV